MVHGIFFCDQERQMAAAAAPVEEEDEADYQTMDDPGYQDFRAETSIHYKLRAECFRKAQEAFSRGLKQVASFYSRQVTARVLLRILRHSSSGRVT